ncbi:MAG: MEDS domain-containing protein [Desulfobacterales bacterium]
MAYATPHTDLEKQLWTLKPGDHLCCIFETEAEHRALLSSFIRQGLDRREKVTYIADWHSREKILDYLLEDGVDPAPFLECGQLDILDARAVYRLEREIDPDRMIGLLKAESDRARNLGYGALRVTGEMSWAIADPAVPEKLIVYEARLNTFFQHYPCLAICQYDRRLFRPEVILDVIVTHPLVIVGTEIYKNFYYMPPEALLSGDAAASRVENWLNNLKTHERAERQIQSLTEALMTAQESERLMISRELHDQVAQDLVSMKLTMETLLLDGAGMTEDIGYRLASLSNTINRTINAVRGLAYDIRPPELDELGIVLALSMFCEDFAHKSDIRVDFQAAGLERLKLAVSTQIHLYRMVQEGLINIRKHAAASRAVVKLVAAFPNILLRIEDDGRGFDVNQRAMEAPMGKRMGLRSLQERARLLGGIMIVRSMPGKGTRIFIRFPIQGAGT